MKKTQSKDLKKMIGPLLILGFKGDTITSKHTIIEQIEEYDLSGVVLFDKDMVYDKPVLNIRSKEQVIKLVKALKQSKPDLFIAVDQEGGKVNRLKTEYGFNHTKSHLELGELSLEQTYTEAQLLVSELEDVGINLNFAPVVDLSINKENPIIHLKERSFSEQADKVVRHAIQYINAHQEKKILTTLKHFPGHGSSQGDSHLGFVDVTDTWLDNEMIPYEQLINQFGFDELIMTAHLFNQNWDMNYPTTFSKKMVQLKLKDELGFKGLVISDDMQMKAITDRYGLDQSIFLALDAGVDLLCYGNNLSERQIHSNQIYEIIEKGLRNKDITETCLIEKIERIKEFKQLKLGIS